MRRLNAIVLSLLAAWLPAAAPAQTFELSEPALELSWPAGNWDGRYAFAPVYCLVFPAPREATRLTGALFNRRSVSLARVLYPKDSLALFVVTSMIPPGRSGAEEVARLQQANQHYADLAPDQLEAGTRRSSFGATGALTIRNPVEGGAGEPFPLVRKIARYEDGLLHSLSVHRLVARGTDRFEIVALRYFREPLEPAGERAQAEAQALAVTVDRTVEALHSCSSRLRLRQRD